MKNPTLFYTTLFMAGLSVAVFFLAYQKDRHVEGLVIMKNLLIQTLPMLFFAFVLASFIQVLVPPGVISRWIGADSGIKGILIASFAGGFLPGGPYVTLPLVIGLAKVGASLPVLVALITGWSLIAVARLPLEIGILGPKLTFLRLASVLVLSPLAGLIALMITKLLKIN